MLEHDCANTNASACARAHTLYRRSLPHLFLTRVDLFSDTTIHNVVTIHVPGPSTNDMIHPCEPLLTQSPFLPPS